jgi:hypothetical protein
MTKSMTHLLIQSLSQAFVKYQQPAKKTTATET